LTLILLYVTCVFSPAIKVLSQNMICALTAQRSSHQTDLAQLHGGMPPVQFLPGRPFSHLYKRNLQAMLTDRYKDFVTLHSFTYLLCRCEEYSCRLGVNARVSSVHEMGVVVHVGFNLAGFPLGKPTCTLVVLNHAMTLSIRVHSH